MESETSPIKLNQESPDFLKSQQRLVTDKNVEQEDIIEIPEKQKVSFPPLTQETVKELLAKKISYKEEENISNIDFSKQAIYRRENFEKLTQEDQQNIQRALVQTACVLGPETIKLLFLTGKE